MRVDSNINSMMQLGNQLEKSANELTKLNETSKSSLKSETAQKEPANIPDLVQEMVNQIQIPIAYTANAQVISTQDSTTQTLLDIKA